MVEDLYRFHTSQRTSAGDNFLKDFFKLMNNSVYGKTQENLRNRVSVELITDARILCKRVAKPTFYRGNPITDCLTVIQCNVATSYDRDPVVANVEVPTDTVVVKNVSVEAPADLEVVECDENTASVSKIIDIELVEEETFDEEINGYRLILNNIFNSLTCPECIERGTFNL